MFTPEEAKKVKEKDVEELIAKCDKSFKDYHGWYCFEMALIHDEYSKELRDAVCKRYLEAGWSYAYHGTSSENGERPGLTQFVVSESPVDPKNLHNMIEVKKEDN